MDHGIPAGGRTKDSVTVMTPILATDPAGRVLVHNPQGPKRDLTTAGYRRHVIGDRVALALRGLVKRFDGVYAVAGIDLDVPSGSFFGLLGPNGAGKTT